MCCSMNMDGDVSNNNTKCESSQSSDESQGTVGEKNEQDSLRNENAWLHLKTLTTFDSVFSSELNNSHSQTHTSNFRSFCDVEKSVLKEKLCKKAHFELRDDCIPTPNESQNYQNSSKTDDKISLPRNALFSREELARSTKYTRVRKRSQSNSVSEGDIPIGAVADPVSHFSVSSSPSRNGTVSDLGAGHTNTSWGSCTPASVQSLTRFHPTSLLVESLIDQLCKLMEKDAGKQRKLYHVICERLHQMQLIDDSYTIEEFQFMRSHYQKALYQLLAVAKSSTQPTGNRRNILLPLPSSTMSVDIKLNSEHMMKWSRYQHEYQELQYLAKGGFGRVYKVRNKLDGGEYAIKKIFLRYRCIEGFLRSLKEVKMLARLNHPNIVSYKAAWLEPFDGDKQKSRMEQVSHSSSSPDASMPILSMTSKSRLPLPVNSVSISEDSLDIVFQDPDHKSNCSQNTTASIDSVKRNDKLTSSSRCPPTESQKIPISSNCSDSSPPSRSLDEMDNSKSLEADPVPTEECKINDPPPAILQNWATLYVQMQLCERTLRQWLDVRNSALAAYPLSPTSNEGVLALTLFQRIVSGVEYIHSQGIVHHDIKPSNIFVDGSLKEVQVGDFGLSCCILSRVDSTGVVGEHHREVGTRLYAAPEQLRRRCTPKSDLYSLGIVLLELLQPFHTDMERSKVIQKLRAGQVPPELSTTWPHAGRLISDLLTSAEARPTASELLRRVQSLLCSNAESDLSCELASKDETIRLLKEAVASRDQEIVELRRRLSLYENDEENS